MFKENTKHEQGNLFGIEQDLDARLKKKLEKHWSTNFYKKVFLDIDEQIFSPLYDEKIGRGNFPVNILAGMEILKELHGLTDEEMFDRFAFDLSFRRALGLKDFNEHVLAERTFYYFRSASAEYELNNGVNLMMAIFKKLRDEYIRELGIKSGAQRSDSAMIGANIKRMSRLMLFHKALSNLVRDIKLMEGLVPEKIEAVVSDDEDNFCYRLKRDEYAARTKELAEYIYLLVNQYRDDWRVCDGKSYSQARRLLEEQCIVTEMKPIELKDPKNISSSSMQNPADDEATYRKKNNTEHRGYAVHATETCDPENEIQIITDIDLVENNVDDAAVLSEKIEMLKEETGLDTIITDGGFVSDETRAACDENGVLFVTSAIRGKSSDDIKNETITSRDFTTDPEDGKITACPHGHLPRSQKVEENTITANFDPGICSQCDKNSECPAFKSEKLSRIVIDDKRRWLDERTELLKTEPYRTLCGLRPPVEGLMSCVKPKYLRGRILFRGKAKVKKRMILKAIAINCKRYWAYSLSSLIFYATRLFDFIKTNCTVVLFQKMA